MRKYHLQCLSFILSGVMLTGCALNNMTVKGVETEAEAATAEEYKNTAQEDAIEDIVETVAGVKQMDGEGYDKEETVFVISDAEGNPTEVIASEWLKNLEGSEYIEDVSSLKDIVNVKGYEEYEKGEGDSLKWEASGNDIYYQGTPSENPPVGVKVSYKLDGKEVTPEEIQGKSGKVEIRIDYENDTDEVIEVNGEEEHVTIPFTMLTGVMLPNDIFSNVEVENGRLITEGNNAIVIGYAFPGLYESLKYDDFKDSLDEEHREKADNLDISDHVVITADAKDFELRSTLTVALPDVLEEVSFTDNIDTDKVKDDMDELADATQELIDGTSDLLDGVHDLKDGTSELKDGTSELKDGTRDLKDGTEDLVRGTDDLMDGAWDMKEGACEAYGGTKKIYDGAKDLKSGASDAYDGTKALKSGAKSAYSGATKLKKGINDAHTGSDTLTQGVSAAYIGSKQLNEGVQQVSGLLTSNAGNAQALSRLAEVVTANLSGSEAASAMEGSALKASGAPSAEEREDALKASLAAMDAANNLSKESVSMLSLSLSENETKEDDEDNTAVELKETLDSLDNVYASAESVMDSVSSLNLTIDEKLDELSEEKDQLEEELSEMEDEPQLSPVYVNDGAEDDDQDNSDDSDSEEDEEDSEETEVYTKESIETIKEYYKEYYKKTYRLAYIEDASEILEGYKESLESISEVTGLLSESVNETREEIEGLYQQVAG